MGPIKILFDVYGALLRQDKDYKKALYGYLVGCAVWFTAIFDIYLVSTTPNIESRVLHEIRNGNLIGLGSHNIEHASMALSTLMLVVYCLVSNLLFPHFQSLKGARTNFSCWFYKLTVVGFQILATVVFVKASIVLGYNSLQFPGFLLLLSFFFTNAILLVSVQIFCLAIKNLPVATLLAMVNTFGLFLAWVCTETLMGLIVFYKSVAHLETYLFISPFIFPLMHIPLFVILPIKIWFKSKQIRSSEPIFEDDYMQYRLEEEIFMDKVSKRDRLSQSVLKDMPPHPDPLDTNLDSEYRQWKKEFVRRLKEKKNKSKPEA